MLAIHVVISLFEILGSQYVSSVVKACSYNIVILKAQSKKLFVELHF